MVSAKAVLAMGRIASFISSMISVGGCASAGFAEAGALVPPTSVGGAPLCAGLPVVEHLDGLFDTVANQLGATVVSRLCGPFPVHAKILFLPCSP
jgi:hypothetical protein